MMKSKKHELEIGQRAPDFQLKDANGIVHSLSDYFGRWIVLYFYPKDNTPGCTIEACKFRDDSSRFKDAGAVVLGINTDNGKSHQSFINKNSLPFTLLIDEKGEASKIYGALFKLGPIQFSKRHTFIINPEGLIAKIYRSVSPSNHSKEIIEDLELLKIMHSPRDSH